MVHSTDWAKYAWNKIDTSHSCFVLALVHNCSVPHLCSTQSSSLPFSNTHTLTNSRTIVQYLLCHFPSILQSVQWKMVMPVCSRFEMIGRLRLPFIWPNVKRVTSRSHVIPHLPLRLTFTLPVCMCRPPSTCRRF